jgi:hypothetical protein
MLSSESYWLLLFFIFFILRLLLMPGDLFSMQKMLVGRVTYCWCIFVSARLPAFSCIIVTGFFTFAFSGSILFFTMVTGQQKGL